MSIFTEERLRTRVSNELRKSYNQSAATIARSIVNESINFQNTYTGKTKVYDIFLSHSTSDANLIAGLKLELEDMGYSVYVDWIEDPLLDRNNVTKETALLLQARMKQCLSFIYAFSENSTNSKWMPWELGYFDGIKGTVAVLPISKTNKSTFIGTEYLGIYYYIQANTALGSNTETLWVHETQSKYVIYRDWLRGVKPTQR